MPTLYKYQERTILDLLGGKRIACLGVGCGKTAVMFNWLRAVKKKKVVIVTTASKVKSGDMPKEAVTWCGQEWVDSLSEFTIISWHKLNKLVFGAGGLPRDLSDYAFAFDECLPADTKVETDRGSVEIADIMIGDKVLSFNHKTEQMEYKTVSRTIKKKAPEKMFRLRLSDGTVIISTENHPHFTPSGYVEAGKIKVGDILYENNRMETGEIWRKRPVWDVWQKNSNRDSHSVADGQVAFKEKDILFDRVRQKSYEREWEEDDVKPRVKGKATGDGFAEDVSMQPLQRRAYEEEDARNKVVQRLEADMDRTPRAKRRQWETNRATNASVGKTKRFGQRLGNGATSLIRQMGAGLSEMLQIRHWKHLSQNRHRMRWSEPLLDEGQSEGQEEGKEIRRVRVESVEVLKLADIKRLGLYRRPDYVYCIDVEDNHNFFANGVLTHNCQKSKGFSTGMGKAFRWICAHCDTWTGYTATPGDQWKDYIAYFVACGLVKNKTEFLRNYCIMQSFRGFPEIIGYLRQDELSAMWAKIATAPDTSEMMRELPSENHIVVDFKKPKAYDGVLKERLRADTGEYIESAPEMCHHLRQLCFTTEKQEWIADFIENLGTNCIFFCNYIEEEEKLCEIAQKALPKGAKVWRIDGTHHDIPTAETIGKYDIVVAHYLSGGEALNFQFMHYWVSVSPNYAYSTSEQARGRIRRIGQTHLMFFYYLWAHKTIEDDIYACLKTKSVFSEKIWAVNNGIDIDKNK